MSKVYTVTERLFFNGKALHDPFIVCIGLNRDIAEREILKRIKLIQDDDREISGPYKSIVSWCDDRTYYVKILYQNNSSALYKFLIDEYSLIES